MHPHCCTDVRCIDEAEACTPCFVEPVRQEPYAIALLHFQVLAMSLGDIGGGETSQVMPIKKNGHFSLRFHTRPKVRTGPAASLIHKSRARGSFLCCSAISGSSRSPAPSFPLTSATILIRSSADMNSALPICPLATRPSR